MTSLRKALLFGFLVWLVPFIVAFVIFPLREASRPLFESIMPVAVTVTAVVFASAYLRGVRHRPQKEGFIIGALWLAICVLIDLPLMLLGGPMQMTFAAYVADIGLTYLIIPAVTIGLGLALGWRQGTS